LCGCAAARGRDRNPAGSQGQPESRCLRRQTGRAAGPAGREESGDQGAEPLITLMVLLMTLITAPLAAQEYGAAETALRTGKYEQAIAAFTKLASADPAPPAALDGLVRSLMIVGRYDEAEAAARRPPELANRL